MTWLDYDRCRNCTFSSFHMRGGAISCGGGCHVLVTFRHKWVRIRRKPVILRSCFEQIASLGDTLAAQDVKRSLEGERVALNVGDEAQLHRCGYDCVLKSFSKIDKPNVLMQLEGVHQDAMGCRCVLISGTFKRYHSHRITTDR